MARRKFALLLITLSIIVAPATSFAYSSKMCTTSKTGPGGAICSAKDVGPFLQDISVQCGNTGTCSLADIMTVFANVGNWVLGIVGAVVLLMYVIGGIYFMTSGARPANRQKGKDYLRISTVGLLIVFFAYAGIQTLNSTLRTHTANEDPVSPEACKQEANAGIACGPSKICVWQVTKTAGSYGYCQSKCTATFGVNSGCFGFSEEKLLNGTGNYETCVENMCEGNGLCCYTIK